MRPAGAPRPRSKLRLAVWSVVATLLALELGLRGFDAVRGRSWNARASWYWMFEQDPFMGFRGRRDVEGRFGENGTGRHNADGFRDDRDLATIDAMPGHRLVVCVGESSTYGIGARDAREAWPARLEAHLRRASGRDDWIVYNAGYPAFTSHQIAQLLHLRLLAHRPAAVILMNLRNDVELVAKFVDERTDYPDLPLALAPMPRAFPNELLMRSALVGLVASRFHVARTVDTPLDGPAMPITPRGKSFYLDNLAVSALLCRRAGVPLLVVDQPIFDDTHPPARRRATAELREAMKAACDEHRLPLLAADRPMHDDAFRPPHEVHLGPEGNDRLAAILAPQVIRALDGEGAR